MRFTIGVETININLRLNGVQLVSEHYVDIKPITKKFSHDHQQCLRCVIGNLGIKPINLIMSFAAILSIRSLKLFDCTVQLKRSTD